MLDVKIMKKTLIVDDMKEVYEKLLEKIGQADYSSNVMDALKKIREGAYTEIITDYHLGEKSAKGGLEILKAASTRGIENIILMSTENHEEEALKFGATKFVFKKDLIKNGR